MPAAVSAEINPPTSPSATHRRASMKVLSRNIDKVSLGNLIFPTWYYSPYPDSIIHDQDTTAISVKSEPGNHILATAEYDGKDDIKHAPPVGGMNGVVKHGSTHHSHHASLLHERAILNMLHVCPYCFRYTSSSADFAGHLALHVKAELDFYTPAHKRSTRRRRSGSNGSDDGNDLDENGSDGAPRPVPDSAVKVYSYGHYTVWDIDGEAEKLYCQNLSLFGKLFLEQKSVFFDTAGFHYFVLTYCPPSGSSAPAEDTWHEGKSRTKSNSRSTRDILQQTSPQSLRKRGKSDSSIVTTSNDGTAHHREPTLDQPSFPLRHQVLGFFSKENLSWDSNNLACILVFPPYQHRNLGQLLMAVSYKLSGWEWEDSIIGGPEKPLSTMGRRSYLRFWSERIARFIMGQSQDAEGLRVFEEGVMEESEDGTQEIMTGKKRKRKHGKGLLKDEFTIKELGDRTGMLGEDVIAALVEMGVCEVVPPKRKKQQKDNGQASGNAGVDAHAHAHADPASHVEREHLTMTVNRSRVLEWAKRYGVDLISPVKEEGFLGEWALSEEEEEDSETVTEEGEEPEEVESD